MTSIPPTGPSRPATTSLPAQRIEPAAAEFKLAAPTLDAGSLASGRTANSIAQAPVAVDGPLTAACREAAGTHASPADAMNAAVVKRLETVYGSEVAMKIGPQVASLLRGDPMISAAFQQVMSTSQAIASMRQS